MSRPQPTRQPLPIIPAGPEALFRVDRVEVEGEQVRSTMATGPWLAGPDGRTAAGALGVLIDNVLGYAIIGHRPANHWSVSTEIDLDIVGPLPDDGSPLHAEASVVAAGAAVGYSSGRVLDDAGRLVAVCRQWGRFVPASSALEAGAVAFETRPDAPDLLGLIGAGPADATGFELDVAGALQNPMHNLHGGISVCAADLVGTLAVADTGPHLTTTAVRIQFLRPVPGGSRLTLSAAVRHRGRSLAVVEVTGSIAGRVCTLARVTAQAV